MSIRWYSVVIDCHDVAAQGRWWAKALDYQIVYEAKDELVIVPPHAATKADTIPIDEQGPGLVFVSVPETKTVKNRLHLDLAPRAGDDHQAQVRRLEELGAARVDVGQADSPWVVLTDPEGNEFCVLTPRD